MNKLTDINQVHGLFVSVQVDLENTGQSDQLNTYPRIDALTYLAGKQKKFTGDSYIDQIERNAIYLMEGVKVLNQTIAKYLHAGFPVLETHKLEEYILATRVNLPREIAHFQIAYLRAGCMSCPYHDLHYRVDNLRTIRNSGRRDEYIEEIEFAYIYYQTHYILSQGFLRYYLHRKILARIASSLSYDSVLSAVESRMTSITAVSANLIDLSAGMEIDSQGNLSFLSEEEIIQNQKNQKKKKWKEIWGEEFEKIRKDL